MYRWRVTLVLDGRDGGTYEVNAGHSWTAINYVLRSLASKGEQAQ